MYAIRRFFGIFLRYKLVNREEYDKLLRRVTDIEKEIFGEPENYPAGF